MQHIGYSLVWRKVNGVDLPVAEAYFHENCQKKRYASHSNFQHNKRTVSESGEVNISRKSAAQGQAYSSVLQILKERVIKRNKIVPLTEIHREFLKELVLEGEENSAYRAFSSVKLRVSVFICILSSAHMTVNETIVFSYLARTRDTLKDAAITLCTMIKKVKKHLMNLPR